MENEINQINAICAVLFKNYKEDIKMKNSLDLSTQIKITAPINIWSTAKILDRNFISLSVIKRSIIL